MYLTVALLAFVYFAVWLLLPPSRRHWAQRPLAVGIGLFPLYVLGALGGFVVLLAFHNTASLLAAVLLSLVGLVVIGMGAFLSYWCIVGLLDVCD